MLTDWKQQLKDGINTLEGWEKDFDGTGTGDDWSLEFFYSKEDADSLRELGVTETYVKWLYENALYDEITSDDGDGERDQYLRFWVVEETLSAYLEGEEFSRSKFRVCFPKHTPEGMFRPSYLPPGTPYNRGEIT